MSTIVIGVDASARSEDAIAFGRRIAAAGTAELIVATVVPSARPRLTEAHALARRMTDLLAEIEGARVRTDVLAAPSVAHGLHDLCERESAALVVVGSSHVGRLGRLHPGSTAERLLHGSGCAVAVVPSGYRDARERGVTRVGVAWDDLPEAQRALAAAIGAARAFGARLEITTVLPSGLIGSPAAMSQPSYASIRKQVENGIRRDLDDAVAASAPLVETVGVVLDGRAWSELADRSADLDLLFAGSRAYGPLHAVLTGGTSGPLTQHAQCPVIVLPRGADAPLVEVFAQAAAPA